MDGSPATLTTLREGALWRVRISSRNNTVGTRLMSDLRAVLKAHASDDSSRVLLLRGDGRKFFCPGLDLLEVGRLDRRGMGRFMKRFGELSLALFSHPKPILAVVNGHALAGGFLLAGCCDFRIGRVGARVGLTPLNRVVPVPCPSLLLLESRFGVGGLSAALFPGVSHEMEEAKARGWVDRVVFEDALEGEAREWALQLAGQSSATFWAMKRPLVEPVAKRAAKGRAAHAEEFLDRWFSEEARERLGELLRRLDRSG